MNPADVLTIGTLFQTSRLFGGEIGTAFMQTFVRVREQVHSNLIGLHVDSLGGQTADRLAAYRNAVGAHSSDVAVAAERATSLLGSAVAKQAAVLSYIDGFLAAAVGALRLPPLHRPLEAALRTAGRRGSRRAVPSASFCATMAPMTTKVRRRLTTLLCADVEGYARLMEADEAGTLATLRRCRAAMATLIERHDGRIVNTWGDAVIAEFASVVEAVQCAVETQQEIFSHNGALPEPQRMRFRIGIHLGDVMVEGDDVYGDGVNIAARLQELAEPGGILISGPVYDQVHNKLSIGFDCLGQQSLKNVANPVTGYRVLQGGAPSRPAASRPG